MCVLILVLPLNVIREGVWGKRCAFGVQPGRPRGKGGRVRDGESVVVFQEVEGRERREVNLEIGDRLRGLYR